MKKEIFIQIVLIFGLLLITTGIYLVIDNFFKQNGLLFEAVMSICFGILMLLITLIITTLAETIKLFSNIFEQQIEIQEKLTTISKLKENLKINKFPGNMTITDIDTGVSKIININEKDDIIKNINNLISKSFFNNKENNIKTLKKELEKAIECEDFEKAEKLKKLIEELNRNTNNDSSES